MRWTHVIIHHSLTTDGVAADWQAIRRYHMSHKYQGKAMTPIEASALVQAGKIVEHPWSDVGYHCGVERINGVVEILLGRGLDQDGAHTTQSGMNRTGIGVMICGDFDTVAPDLELLTITASRCVAPLMKLCGIPLHNLKMHRDFATYKSCPGWKFPWEQFAEIVAGRLGQPSSGVVTT